MSITIYPSQVRSIIRGLVIYAEDFEEQGLPHWYALASAAACLESILRGETPTDADQVSQRLKSINAIDPSPRRFGKRFHGVVSTAEVMIEGNRLGVLLIQREVQQIAMPPVWIGIDLATGQDKTIFGGNCHA
jgi:hypothetical protein